jgi:hypothetical protein
MIPFGSVLPTALAIGTLMIAVWSDVGSAKSRKIVSDPPRSAGVSLPRRASGAYASPPR